MHVVAWVVSAVVLVESGVLLVMVSRMTELIDAPPRRRRRAMLRMLRMVGIWQISIGALIVVFNVQRGDGWSSLSSVTSLGLMGLLFILVPWFWTPDLMPRVGEEPDLEDPKDVERWLRGD